MSLVVRGGTVIGPDGLLEGGTVVLDDDAIVSVEGVAGGGARTGSTGEDAGDGHRTGAPDRPSMAGDDDGSERATIDATGLIVAPGFIELQLNGAFGVDFTAQPGRIWEVAAQLAPQGITAFLPTIVSAAPAAVAGAREALERGPAAEPWRGAIPLGLHLEGPFLSRSRPGAHRVEFLSGPESNRVRDWSPGNGIRLVTLAPELPGALRLVAALLDRGVIVAAGHSAATYAEAQAGFAAGITAVTHLFNAMQPFDHREPGLVGAALLDDRITIGVIPDGVHLAPATVALTARVVGPRRLSTVTDAISALGMTSGRFILGDVVIETDGTAARLPDGRLAGSLLRLDQAIRNVAAFTGWDAVSAIQTVTGVPARLLGLGRTRGVLTPGAVSDAVLLTPGLQVVATIIGGRIVHGGDLLGGRLVAAGDEAGWR